MKKIILPLMAIAMITSAFAQNYYIIKKTGTGSDYSLGNGTGTVTKILTTGNDILSAAQTIPFAWNYYGSPVTSFKATDNGYITFDAAATTTTGINTTVPNAGGPNNAIYAFWDDLELKTFSTYAVDVRTWTTGSAGSRMHYIQWMLCTKNGVPITTQHALYFCIRLKEKGGFDVINNYGFGQTFSATIGCENADGSLGVQDAGSPNINTTVNSWSNATDVIYEFHYGVQPAFDAYLVNSNLLKAYKVGTGVTIGGNVTNYGSTTITDLTINYSVDGGATQTYTMTGLGLLPSGASSSAFTHNIPWTSGAAGTLSTIKTWVSNPNGGTDGDLTNDDVTNIVLRNNGTSNVPRNVLVEEATGAWCGFCPDGHITMADIVTNNTAGRVIPVMHHNADKMTNTQSDILNSAYAGGFPSAFFDRTTFSGNRPDWATQVDNRLSVDAPVKVTITAKNWNPTNRTIVFRVNANFSDYWAGDIRIGGIVTEDDVRGSGGSSNNNQWNQHNYYSKFHSSGGVGGASSPLYNELEYMEGYLHQHVARSLPGGAFGLAAVIPDVAEPNTDYNYDFSYVLPAETKVTYSITNNTDLCNTNHSAGEDYGWNKLASLNLIGFVAEYDGANVGNRPILNAGAVKLWNIAANTQDIKSNVSINSVFPNPANDFANVKIDLTENSNVKIEVFNSMGQLVSLEQEGLMQSGTNVFFINTTNYSSGIYTVTVTTANGSTSSKLNVVK